MSLQLLQEISDNYQMAKLVHEESANLFWYIYMPGYALLHEYQLLSESITQRKIKRYITSTYHTFMPDKIPESANIMAPLLSGKNRKMLKTEDSWKIIKSAFEAYQKWEESTLKKYERVASELVAKGDVAAFNFVGEIIKDVKEELVYVTDKIIELEAHGYDMPQIVGEQGDYVERYEYLIKNLLGKSMMGHHWNSLNDAESRTNLLEKHPD